MAVDLEDMIMSPVRNIRSVYSKKLENREIVYLSKKITPYFCQSKSSKLIAVPREAATV